MLHIIHIFFVSSYAVLFISFLLDIDECTDVNYTCDGECTNTEGDWDCKCEAGYMEKSVNNTFKTCSGK